MGDRPHAVRAVVLLALALFVSFAVAVSAAVAGVGSAGDTWTQDDRYGEIAIASDGLLHSHTAVLRLSGPAKTLTVRDDGYGRLALDGYEPLLPGERLSFAWTKLGKRARLTTTVADPLRRARTVTVPLRAADRRTTVSVSAGGGVTIVRGADTTVSPEPPLGLGEPGGPQPAPWTAATPQAAVTAALATLRNPAAPSSLARYCWALDPPIAANYTALVRDDWALSPVVPTCAAGLGEEMADNDNSIAGDTTGSILSTRNVSPTEAVVRARLVNRYLSEQPAIHRTVDVYVVRAAANLPWRIADETALVPPYDPESPGEAPGRSTLKELRRLYRQQAELTASNRAIDRADQRRIAKATVPVSPGAATCPTGSGSTKQDGGDDALVLGHFPGRDAALMTADVRSARLVSSRAGRCLTIRFAAPPPARFQVNVRTIHGADIWVADGHAVLFGRGAPPNSFVGTVVSGLTAALDGRTLVLRIPSRALEAPSSASNWSIRVDGPHPYAPDLQDRVPNAKVDR